MTLEVRGLHKRYGGVHALKGVDFRLEPGTVHALVGENGAGKSTLIKIVSGIVPPDEGEILVDARPVRIDSARAAQALGIQTVHQELELAPTLSVGENVYLGRLPARFGFVQWNALHANARTALQRIGAEIDPHAQISSLPVADRQVVEIAKALERRARVLILDEPTAALPPSEVARLLEHIRALASAGVAVVYVSHRLDEVTRVADCATVLRDGRKVAMLRKQELSRDTLTFHILGRELAGFVEKPVAQAEAPGAAPALRCEGLAALPEIEELSFTARPGEVIGFFGLLGAGHSSIGDALFGLKKAEARDFRTRRGGALPRTPSEALAQGLGYVSADRKGTGLAMPLSVEENLVITNLHRFSRMGFRDRDALREFARGAAARYQIKCSSLEQPVRELSGGNQQKVSIGKWAAREVDTLFLDEPTRGVDVGSRVEVYRLLRAFAAEGGCCLFASSEAAEIGTLADRALVMKRGRVAAELAGAQITEEALLEAAL